MAAGVATVFQEFQAFLVVPVPRDQLVEKDPQGGKAAMDPRVQLVHQEKRVTQEFKEDLGQQALRVLQGPPREVAGNSAFLKI